MVVLEDTRNKPGQHDNISEYFADHGIGLVRSKIVCGDYCSPPTISVDTKQGLGEIYQDLIQDHDRFKRECILAQSIGTKLIILIEMDEDGITCVDDVWKWKNPRYDEWLRKYSFALAGQRKGKTYKAPKPPVSSDRLMRMMETMTERYGVEWQFCRYEDTGQRLEEILHG